MGLPLSGRFTRAEISPRHEDDGYDCDEEALGRGDEGGCMITWIERGEWRCIALHWSRGSTYHGDVQVHTAFTRILGATLSAKRGVSCDDDLCIIIFKRSYLDGVYVQDMYKVLHAHPFPMRRVVKS